MPDPQSHVDGSLISTKRDLPRTVGLLSAAGIMVGVTIGSGIYKTPAEIARAVDAPWQIVAAWLVGGLLSLFGALTYAELATMFPRSGGLYNFLYQGFGPRMSFIFGWTFMLITKPLAAAGIAVVFTEYLGALFGSGYEPWLASVVPFSSVLQDMLGDSWHNVMMVCLVIALLTWVNWLGMRQGSGFNLVLTIIKVACLGGIVGCAALYSLGVIGQSERAVAEVAQSATSSASTGLVMGVSMLALAPLLSAVLWTYDGWSDIGAVAGEVKEPQKNLPRIYLIGTLALIVIYLAVNVAYLSVLSLEEMRGSSAVASDAMVKMVGPVGAGVVTIFVLISTLGSTHASIMTGARVTFAQAQDGLLFSYLAKIHPTRQTPSTALWTQMALSCACAIFFKEFNNLAGGFVFTMWIFYGLGGIAMMRLRKKMPEAARAYRCWGYPFVPLLFIASAGAMTALQIYEAFKAPTPAEGIAPWIQICIFLGILAVGYPAYDIWRTVVLRIRSTRKV